jgi:xanthine dehydrogenase YagR molybdenum-binding subunit
MKLTINGPRIPGCRDALLETQKYSMHSYCAQFCEVKVSTVTAEVRVPRFLGSFDTGRLLNPKSESAICR